VACGREVKKKSGSRGKASMAIFFFFATKSTVRT
jgi:hypothetical protein